MSENRRHRANRENAGSSTGPRTAYGKKRASQNARRHGLAVPVLATPTLAPEVEALAKAIAGEKSDPQIFECARRIAEAQIDIRRVRQATTAVLDNKYLRVEFPSNAEIRAFRKLLAGLSAKKPVLPPPGLIIKAPSAMMLSLEEGMLLIATRLARLDRYERRALSRRKKAMRDFEAAARSSVPQD